MRAQPETKWTVLNVKWTSSAVFLNTLAVLALQVGCGSRPANEAPEPASDVISSPASAATFLPRASPNGRYLVDQTGTPYFMVGGSPQNLASFSLQDATLYLSTRAAQGFNTVQVYTLPFNFGSSHSFPAGSGAGYPFLRALDGGPYSGSAGTADFLTPNPAYFAYLDQILDLATSRGFLVHLYAIDYGYNCTGTEGWWLDVVANPASSLQSFGTYLGNRYKNRSNVVWVDGSDCNRNGDPDEQKVLQFVVAMRAAGATQLRTGDWSAFPPSISTDETLFTPYMQLNGLYSYNSSIYLDARTAWGYAPVAASQGNPGSSSAPVALPTYLKETDYELSFFSPGDPTSVRKLEYQAVLSGATAGFFFENEAVVRQYADWQTEQLDTPGARDAARLGALFQSFAWWKLVPSELSSMRRLITSANGGQSSLALASFAAAQAADGSFLFAYVPPGNTGSQTFDVDLRSMAGTSRARWWDPTSGSFSAIGNLPNTGIQTLITPGNNSSGANDWVLVLDVANGIAVSPAAVSVAAGGQTQFTATAYQNGAPLSPQPAFTWSVSGGGTISSSGLFTAGSAAGGPFAVSVSGASLNGSASVTVTSSNVAPTGYVQGASIDAGTVAGSSLAFSSANAAHDLIVAAVRIGSPTIAGTITDTQGNAYHLATSQTQTTDGSRVAIYYASNIAGGANTVSVQLNGTATLRFAIYEYGGLSTLDRTAGAEGTTGTTLSTPNTATTSRANELVFAAGLTSDPVAYTAGVSYTQRHAVSGKLLTEDRIVNAVGTYAGAATMNPSHLWAMAVATFY